MPSRPTNVETCYVKTSVELAFCNDFDDIAFLHLKRVQVGFNSIKFYKPLTYLRQFL